MYEGTVRYFRQSGESNLLLPDGWLHLVTQRQIAGNHVATPKTSAWNAAWDLSDPLVNAESRGEASRLFALIRNNLRRRGLSAGETVSLPSTSIRSRRA